MKPIKRSRIRLIIGKYYFRYKRYLEWFFGEVKFARENRDGYARFFCLQASDSIIKTLERSRYVASSIIKLKT